MGRQELSNRNVSQVCGSALSLSYVLSFSSLSVWFCWSKHGSVSSCHSENLREADVLGGSKGPPCHSASGGNLVWSKAKPGSLKDMWEEVYSLLLKCTPSPPILWKSEVGYLLFGESGKQTRGTVRVLQTPLKCWQDSKTAQFTVGNVLGEHVQLIVNCI